MALQKQRLQRKFRYNGMDLPDPNPEAPTQRVLEALSATYPELASAKVEPPTVENEFHVFNIKVVTGTKG